MKNLISSVMVLIFCTALATNLKAQEVDTAITVKVKGITCGVDLKMIQTNVEELEGVSECKVVKQGSTTSFEIRFNPALVRKEEVHAAIEGTGSCEDPDARPFKVKL